MGSDREQGGRLVDHREGKLPLKAVGIVRSEIDGNEIDTALTYLVHVAVIPVRLLLCLFWSITQIVLFRRPAPILTPSPRPSIIVAVPTI